MTKPRIYAHCSAGCKWETVHREDFERAATYIEQKIDSAGSCVLEEGKEYRVFTSKKEDGNFDCSIVYKYSIFNVEDTYYEIPITFENSDEYADSFVFRMLAVEIVARAGTELEAYAHRIRLVYEIAGMRYEQFSAWCVEGMGKLNTFADGLTVTGATRVLLINTDASILARDGDNAYIRYSAYPDGTDFTEDLQEGQIYIGHAIGQEAPTDKSGYTWARLVGEKGDKGDKGDTGEISQAYAHNTFANALKSKKSGAAILLPDVSPIEHEMGVKVRSKNLWSGASSYSLEGTGENASIAIVNVEGVTGTITLSTDALITNAEVSASGYLIAYQVKWRDNEAYRAFISSTDTTSRKVQYVINADEYGGIQQIILRKYSRWTGGTIELSNVQLELGATATPYTPYVSDLSAVSLKRQGKNLIKPELIAISNYISPSISNAIYLPKGTYIFSVDSVSCTNWRFEKVIWDKDGNKVFEENRTLPRHLTSNIPSYQAESSGIYLWNAIGTHAEEIITLDDDYYFAIGIAHGDVTSSTTVTNPMLEIGSTATDYEPYIEPTTYAVNEDGTVEGVTPIYPNTTLTTDTSGAVIECEYNRDINKAFAELQQAIISFGGNV